MRKNEKSFAELGYSSLDTAEIVTLLNRLLSNYSIYMQKLRNFHWSVAGIDFFDMHRQFKNMYRRAIKETDKVAERICLFGKDPVSTYAGYIELAGIREETAIVSPFEMAKVILTDIRILLDDMEKVVLASMKINDHGTEYLMKSLIYKLEKDHWMLASWIKAGL